MVGEVCLKEQGKIVLQSIAKIHLEPDKKQYWLEVDTEPTTSWIIQQKNDSLILLRKNESLRMRYTFQLKKITKGICQVNDIPKPIWFNIKTTKLTRDPGLILIEYVLENTPYQFEIKWREL